MILDKGHIADMYVFLSAVTVCPVAKILVTAKTKVGNRTDSSLFDCKYPAK